MASEFIEIVRRINKNHVHLSREGDKDPKRAYLHALIEASQELSSQVSRKWL